MKISQNVKPFLTSLYNIRNINLMYSKEQILQTRIIRIHAYSEVISIPRQKPFKMIRKNEC